MASITIQTAHKNLIFAAAVANSTGATFEETGRGVVIRDTPELTIPRYEFDEIFETNQSDPNRLDRAWRSLLLNKVGYLRFFDDTEIVICDDPPKNGQANFLLRFPTSAEKKNTEEWAERLGYASLTEYILAAIEAFNQSWEQANNG